jgi:hypothetical protein
MKFLVCILVLYLVQYISGTYVVTDCSEYNVDGKGVLPSLCPPGTTDYSGECVLECPESMRRTSLCTCARGSMETNCTKFGGVQKEKCSEDEESFNGLCSQKCQGEMTRSGACTCSDLESFTSCRLYGPSKKSKVCPPGTDMHDGLCYKGACPDNSKRVGPCACEF